MKYNTLMLNHTMDSYEKHFDLIKRQMLMFFYSENVQALSSAPNYREFPDLQLELSSYASNTSLFIHNIALFPSRGDFVLEKGTSTTPQAMFNVFYENEAYGLDFWRGQFEQNYNFRVMPAAVFRNRMFSNQTIYEHLIPVVFKARENSDMLMIVYLDADKMHETFHQTASGDFMIRDERGQTLFQSAGQEPPINPAELRMDASSEYKSNGTYFFQVAGKYSGFTYVKRVPVERIASQSRLNKTLIGATAVSIAAAIIISWMFAAGINRPIQKVIGSIRGESAGGGFRSSIREFNIIRHQIQDKNKTDKQLSILQELKAIRSHSDMRPYALADKPFVLVLFHVMSRREEDAARGSFQTWLSYMRVYMEERLGKAFPDSMTFAIEANQIISLVHTDRREVIIDQLARFEKVFEQDKAFGNVTIAVSHAYEHSDRIAAAFQEVTDLIGGRVMSDRTQLLTEPAEGSIAIDMDLDQWREFQVNLREGNEPQLTNLIRKVFAKRQGKELTAAAWLEFGRNVIGKIKNEASPIVIAPGRLQEIFHQADKKMQQCVTAADLERLLIDWTAQAAEGFRSRKQLRDPITSAVVDYVNRHLSEEIYLDMLAEHLNLSSGYLSAYFKEKSGMNFVDYINETRIMKATTLLGDNTLKIHDVAEAVGYRNITSFNRMFKKYMGVTPSEFRRKQSADA
ncbi:helix-turn-helix domain-containing protein [Paenibacillus methanolicus]|uniref:helix-turn-helix domain-containing protein n=1 Tax=Paenibacillus methanolicus TaxID=582686 RepID=UPI0016530FDE|nr:helix-turn-helix domain-containing protein [Paenibacillus methanolicus]